MVAAILAQNVIGACKMYTDEQLDDLQYSVEYAKWLQENSIDLEIIICNGNMLLEAQERAIGFEEFLKTLEK